MRVCWPRAAAPTPWWVRTLSLSLSLSLTLTLALTLTLTLTITLTLTLNPNPRPEQVLGLLYAMADFTRDEETFRG